MEKLSAWEDLLEKVASGLMVRTHSKQVRPGEVFVAMPGRNTDGSQYIPEALNRGASFVVAQSDAHWPVTAKAKLIPHPNPRAALGELAAAYFQTARHAMTLIGVTGTNGKTTVSYMLEHMLSAAGRKVGVLGTVNYRWPGFFLESPPLTTPDCWQIHDLLSNMAASGVDTVVMEVSSHALDQDRVAGLDFNMAVITNVTQDHLDYHDNMDAYFKAKSRLFHYVPFEDKVGVINWDDPYCRIILSKYAPAVGFGLTYTNLGEGPGLVGSVLSCTGKGLRLSMSYGDQRWELNSPLVGRHNASNLLAAQAAGLALGLKPKKLLALKKFKGVPGRLERVENGPGLDVFVDYAHTPDALENVLSALKELDFKRTLVVFGCGGNRDRTKRPLMGEAVCRYADVVVLTSDNPRDEKPEAIMADVRPGLSGCPQVIEEPDRRVAIKLAVDAMRKGDVLLIAGKGHESCQEICGQKYLFSDIAVAREILG